MSMCEVPFQCFYISNRAVDTRLCLLSSVPLRLIRKSSANAVRELFLKGYIGYFKLSPKNMFCLSQTEEFLLNLEGAPATVAIRRELSSPQYLTVHGWPRAKQPLSLLKSCCHVLYLERITTGVSIYRSYLSFNFDESTIVLERTGKVHNHLLPYHEYDVIIFRVRRLLDREKKLLKELSETPNQRRPATVCYVEYSDRLADLSNCVDALYPLGCSSEQQYEHLLSAVVCSKNRKFLRSLLAQN